jgi:hypothetical protein
MITRPPLPWWPKRGDGVGLGAVRTIARPFPATLIEASAYQRCEDVGPFTPCSVRSLPVRGDEESVRSAINTAATGTARLRTRAASRSGISSRWVKEAVTRWAGSFELRWVRDWGWDYQIGKTRRRPRGQGSQRAMLFGPNVVAVGHVSEQRAQPGGPADALRVAAACARGASPAPAPRGHFRCDLFRDL